MTCRMVGSGAVAIVALLVGGTAGGPARGTEKTSPPRLVHAARPAALGVVDPSRLAPAPPRSATQGEPRLIPNVFPDAAEIARGEEQPLEWPHPAGGFTFVTGTPGAQAGTFAFPAIDVRFDGPYDGGVAPPDSQMAVGRDHVVSIINLKIAMYDKAGNLLQGPFGLSSFFGIPAEFGPFDPLAIYDPFSDRFIVECAADYGAGQDSRLYVAFSQTANPTGAWNTYYIDADAGQAANWADYPAVGIDRLAVYFTANMFARGGSFSNATLFIYDKEDGYAGRPLDNTHVIDVRTEANGGAYRLRPAYVSETVPGDEYYLAHTDSSFGDRINLWRLSGDRFASPTLVGSSISTPGTFYPPGKGRQPGTSKRVDSLGTNLWNVWYHAGKLWTGHALAGSLGGIAAWVHRLDVSQTPATREQTYQVEVSGEDTYYPYVLPAANDDDFALLSAYSGPDTYVTGRYWNIDASGTVRYAEQLASGQLPNNSGRHGDYFAIGADPRDRNRVWMIAQYMKNSTFSGNSAIVSVRFEDVPPPSAPPPVPDGQAIAGQPLTVTRAGSADLTVTWDVSRCPGPGNHLIWYDLGALALYTVTGETCVAGTAGTWTGTPPAGNLGVIVVSDDTAATEGSHGVSSSGQERPSRSASCGFTQKVTTGTCP